MAVSFLPHADFDFAKVGAEARRPRIMAAPRASSEERKVSGFTVIR
jgi:hypothetical protein